MILATLKLIVSQTGRLTAKYESYLICQYPLTYFGHDSIGRQLNRTYRSLPRGRAYHKSTVTHRIIQAFADYCSFE